MWRSAITLWFTFAAALGPSLCCCDFTVAAEPVNGTVPQSSASAPAKSCCKIDLGLAEDKPLPPAKEKPQCPCRHFKEAAEALPTLEEVADERSLPTEFPFWSPVPFHELRASEIGVPQFHPTAYPPSGRALLAAYSILRC